MNLRKKENLSLLCQPTQIISSLIYPSCQEKTQNLNQKKSYEAAAGDGIMDSCGWGMREVAVGFSLWTVLESGTAETDGPF